ncbi:hypothetical protein SAMN05661010_02164 [Modicisalibacter muralis]|uniref:Uncharacterized protein n=1 Tax=Modicisalibacter muralis TaxID=119000 RepID=A0A1G9LMR6_9GAMM|nr:hypothetical protein [Halomonas muralis]SDL63240.1 hypothetical protein SAMN05661010_02164 [Halomonas muralis]
MEINVLARQGPWHQARRGYGLEGTCCTARVTPPACSAVPDPARDITESGPFSPRPLDAGPEAAELQLRCHQIRHWFVTQALNDIHQHARSEEDLQNLRSSLRELMAWKSDMLPVYDQAIRRHDLTELAHRIHARIEREHQDDCARCSQPVSRHELLSESHRTLEEMLGSCPRDLAMPSCSRAAATHHTCRTRSST